jgi:hypothetical protein
MESRSINRLIGARTECKAGFSKDLQLMPNERPFGLDLFARWGRGAVAAVSDSAEVEHASNAHPSSVKAGKRVIKAAQAPPAASKSTCAWKKFA